MNKNDIVLEISNKCGVSKRAAAEMLDLFTSLIARSLKKGEKVTITGFGTFTLSKRSARTGVNPRRPEERIQIPAMKTPHFKAGKTFKESVR